MDSKYPCGTRKKSTKLSLLRLVHYVLKLLGKNTDLIFTAEVCGLPIGRLRDNSNNAKQHSLFVGKKSWNTRKTLQKHFAEAWKICKIEDFLNKFFRFISHCKYYFHVKGEVNHDMILDIPYLDQVMNEVLRMYPTATRYIKLERNSVTNIP